MKKLPIILILFLLGVHLFGQEEEVAPLPDPPALEKRILLSDLIVHARLVHSLKIEIGKDIISQPRFEVVKVLYTSSFFPLKKGEFFTVNHELKPAEWGPYFQESPENGEYIVFLQVKNISLKNKLVYYTQFILPHPFALENTGDTSLEEIVKLISTK